MRRHRRRAGFWRGIGGGLIVLAAMTLGVVGGSGFSPVAQAATFTVINVDNAGPGSLRNAIEAANAAPPGPHLVVFDTEALSLPGTIVLTGGDLPVAVEIEIRGPGAELLSISGGDSSRIFNVGHDGAQGPVVTISGLTIQDGDGAVGGGIRAWGNAVLTVDQSVVDGNASPFGGGILAQHAAQVTLNETVVTGNNGGIGGGMLVQNDATATINDSTIEGNKSSFVGGGLVVQNNATATFNNSVVDGNAADTGGGILVQNDAALTLNVQCGDRQQLRGRSGRRSSCNEQRRRNCQSQHDLRQ